MAAVIPLPVVTAVVAAALSFGAAWKVQDWRHDAAELARKEDAAELVRLRARKADTAAVTHEEFKEKERVVYQVITETVDRIVERPVYRDTVCLQPDGLRALNSAIRGGADDPGKSAPAVP